MAVLHSIGFIALNGSWILDLYMFPQLVSEQSFHKLSALDMFFNMALIYNLFVHCSIIPVNLVIILKEI